MSTKYKRVMRDMVSKLIVILAVLGLAYLGLVILVYIGQSGMMYFPTRALAATPDRIGLTYEDVWLQTRDGVRIHGWYVPAEDPKSTTLMLHGNGGNISHRLQTLNLLNQLGSNTFIIDYRGYGMSEGEPSEEGTYLDARAAWDHLRQDREAEKIVVFGRSLGGAVAAWLAAEVNPHALILESTFSSVVDMATAHYPYLPVRYLSRFSYDSVAIAPRIRSKTIMLHSRSDEIVPFELGTRLYDALPGQKSFVEMRGGHNDGFIVTGEAYVQALKNFLDPL